MTFYDIAFSFGVAVFAVCYLSLMFRPLEKSFPARKRQRYFRPAWFTDLCFLMGQYLVWGGLVLWIMMRYRDWLQDMVPAEFREAVASQSWWLQAIEVVLLSDFLIYWGHRAQHHFPFLWRFHSVHHTSEHLDWLAAFREHPLDSVYSMALLNLPFFVMGFPVETLTKFIAFRGIWAIYIHSNVRLPIGPLRMLIGAPELHHWHHDRDRDAGNYANLSPLMDILFGTYRCPDHEPERFGIHGPKPGGYLSQLIRPLLPARQKTQREPIEVEAGRFTEPLVPQESLR